MKKEDIKSSRAPQAIGPYSQVVKWGNLLFLSGQVGIDPKTGNLHESFDKQVKQIFKNIESLLSSADTTFDDVLKVNVYLKNIDDFTAMNEIYSTYFKKPYPARATIEVARLPKGALIEIDIIVGLKKEEEKCCGGDCGCC